MATPREVRLRSGATRWQVDALIGGQRHFKRFKTKKQAQEYLLHQEHLEHARSLGVISHQEIRLSMLIKAWKASPSYQSKPQESRQRDDYAFDRLLEHVSDVLVHTITPARLESLQMRLLEPYLAAPYRIERRVKGRVDRERVEIRQRRERSPATVNRLMDSISALLSKAVEWNHAESNPCCRVKDLPTDPPRIRHLSEEEAHRLLEAARRYGQDAPGKKPHDPHDLHERILFLLSTGARSCEAAKVTWRDINWEKSCVTFCTAKRGRSTAHRERGVPLSGECLQMLRERCQRQSEADLKILDISGNDARPVFGMDPQMRQRFKRTCARLGIHGVTVHTLRHTYASWLVMKGVSLYKVQKLLGHTDPRMTMIYAHLSPEAFDGIGELLPRFTAMGSS